MNRTLAQQLSGILEGRLPEPAKEKKSLLGIFSKNNDREMLDALGAQVGQRYTGNVPERTRSAIREAMAQPRPVFASTSKEYRSKISARFNALEAVSQSVDFIEYMIATGWLKGKYYLGLRAAMMAGGYREGHLASMISCFPEEYKMDAMLSYFLGLLKKGDVGKVLIFFKKLASESPSVWPSETSEQDYLFDFAEENMGVSFNGYFSKCIRILMNLETEILEKQAADRRAISKSEVQQFKSFEVISTLPQAELYPFYKIVQLAVSHAYVGYFQHASQVGYNLQKYCEEKLEWNEQQVLDHLKSSIANNKWTLLDGLVQRIKKNHTENTLSQNVFEAFSDYVHYFIGRGYKMDKLEPLVRKLSLERDSGNENGEITLLQKLNSGFAPIRIPNNHNPYHGLHPDQIRPYFQLLKEVTNADIIKFYQVNKIHRIRFMVKENRYDIATGEGFGLGIINDLNTVLFENEVPYQFVVLEHSSFSGRGHASKMITLFNESNYRRLFMKLKPQNLAGFAPTGSVVPPFRAHISEIRAVRSRPGLDEFNLEEDAKFQALREQIGQLESKSVWARILAHASQSSLDKKPSAAWLKKGKAIVEEMPEKHFVGGMVLLLDGMIKNDEWFLDDEKLTILRGLTALCRKQPDEVLIFALQKTANKAYRKVKGGPLNAKLGNIALESLSTIGTVDAFGALGNMLAKSKYTVYQRAIRSAMKKFKELMAEYTPDQLADLSVPTHGLMKGEKRIVIDNYEAILTLDGLKIKIAWLNEKGKLTKSAPAELRREKAAEVKAVRATAKSIEETLLAQARRLEGGWFQCRKWIFSDWKKYIGEHALMQFLAEKLIWMATEGEEAISFSWKEMSAQTIDGQQLRLNEKMEIRLWHPALASVNEVLAWRNLIFERKMVQPFKQAFREVYLLTPAEEETYDQSFRFSGHVLEGNKLYSLGKTRGWKMTYDQAPERDLPNGIVAVLNINGGVLYSNCTTMDLHFKQKVSGERGHYSAAKIPLADLPPELLSEVMRDVDLFMAVASLAVDPYFDQNNTGELLDYWRNRSFGEKSKTSISDLRRDLLGRILPMTKIADQCHLEGNYLHVEGKIRGYKINLGSGNILMKPNDQYLCIVPGRNAKLENQIWLPFEGGDATLTIILSKAFLLADDENVKDSSIRGQIGRRLG